jgi:hypothetical protein
LCYVPTLKCNRTACFFFQHVAHTLPVFLPNQGMLSRLSENNLNTNLLSVTNNDLGRKNFGTNRRP